MIDQAFRSFIVKLAIAFPEVESINLNWQGSNVKVKYPYMVALTVNSDLQFFTSSVQETLSDGVIMNTGQWETRINVHYLSDQGSKNNQSEVIQKFVDFMQSDLTSRKSESPSLVIPFGRESYKKCNLSLLGWELSQNSGSIQKGDRRVIFELLMDTPRLVKVTTPIIREIVQNTEVAEDARNLSN